MEASTPFVNLRSILSTFGFKKSRAYVINGILMMITFFVFRILMWPFTIQLFGQEANLSFVQVSLHLRSGLTLSLDD